MGGIASMGSRAVRKFLTLTKSGCPVAPAVPSRLSSEPG